VSLRFRFQITGCTGSIRRFSNGKGEFRFCFFETRLPDAMAKSVRSVAIELHENAKAIEA
jgi:hypothetical protein